MGDTISMSPDSDKDKVHVPEKLNLANGIQTMKQKLSYISFVLFSLLDKNILLYSLLFYLSLTNSVLDLVIINMLSSWM